MRINPNYKLLAAFEANVIFGAVVKKNNCRRDHKIFPNTRVPPRPRSLCVAVSPRRGEQRPLWRASGRDQQQ